MKIFSLFIGLFFPFLIFGQNIAQKMNTAFIQLENDPQFKNAIISFYAVETNTGKVVYKKNEQLGLAPASCQKIITSASAFELLGSNYRYKTNIYLKGLLKDNVLKGGLFVEGFGDPTLGSWRFESTKNESFFNKVSTELQLKGIKKIEEGVKVFKKNYDFNAIPRGWIWEDIGNYYGAGAAAINWRENQYDIILASENEIGKPVKIVKFIPENLNFKINNKLTSAAKGSGDNAYVFLGLNNDRPVLAGTIPVNEKQFAISGAIANSYSFFENQFNYFLQKNNFLNAAALLAKPNEDLYTLDSQLLYQPFANYNSPPLDSINYWFLKKSINLYGEAFVKTIAYEKLKLGSTESGIEIIKNFWKENGIEKSAINIVDGSGLSPSNRVTTQALVTVMQFAKKQKWFTSFYNALPEINSIKMKDGYISGVRSYTGLIKSKAGTAYTFSFIVNNFYGSPTTVRQKMWRILDILKLFYFSKIKYILWRFKILRTILEWCLYFTL